MLTCKGVEVWLHTTDIGYCRYHNVRTYYTLAKLLFVLKPHWFNYRGRGDLQWICIPLTLAGSRWWVSYVTVHALDPACMYACGSTSPDLQISDQCPMFVCLRWWACAPHKEKPLAKVTTCTRNTVHVYTHGHAWSTRILTVMCNVMRGTFGKVWAA